MSEKNKAVVRRWFEEVWNQGRAAAVDEMFAINAVAHGLGNSELDVNAGGSPGHRSSGIPGAPVP